MPTYKVSNKKIIISPKKSVGKVFAWTIGLTGLVALTIRQFLGESTSNIISIKGARFAEDAAAPARTELSHNLFGGPAEIITESAVEAGGSGFIQYLTGIGAWSWFLIGAWFAIFLFFAITLINDKRHKI